MSLASWGHDACSTTRPIRRMRIVGGKFAGRDLTSPRDFRVRPTAEHVRAALLDVLAPDLQGARVLDLFAGTGALGLEALSRGARHADFVEFRPASLHALKANIAALRVRERTRVLVKDALPFAAALAAGSYDVAFVDPPYGSRQLDRVIDGWHATRFARVLAVEHAREHDLPAGALHRAFDDTMITIYRAEPASEPTA
ncbi:MAG: 16S rRNA (guanine(966)-N(2))-methyltransferase RsmD [Gemmatirosa sp.]